MRHRKIISRTSLWTRQAIYVWRNSEVRSCNHCCRGKAMSNTQRECVFYIRSSVHRNSRLKKSNEMQQYTDIYLLLNYSTCFGRPSRPSSGVHKTVDAASGTDHTMWGASFFKRDQIRTFEAAYSPHSMICTRGCIYSFMYSWWWARWTSETCRVI